MLCTVLPARRPMWMSAYARSRSRNSTFCASSRCALLQVAVEEHAHAEAQVGEQPLVQVADLGHAGLARSCGSSSIFLSSMSGSTRSMMSPTCSMLIVNETMSAQRRPSLLVERLARDLRQVELDRRVELVDDVVHACAARRRARGRCCGSPAACRAASSRRRRRCAAPRAPRTRSRAPACRAPSGSRWRGLAPDRRHAGVAAAAARRRARSAR